MERGKVPAPTKSAKAGNFRLEKEGGFMSSFNEIVKCNMCDVEPGNEPKRQNDWVCWYDDNLEVRAICPNCGDRIKAEQKLRRLNSAIAKANDVDGDGETKGSEKPVPPKGYDGCPICYPAVFCDHEAGVDYPQYAKPKPRVVNSPT